MKKILLALSVLALCGCSTAETQKPISGDDVHLALSDDNTNFSVTIPELEAKINYVLPTEFEDYTQSSFKEEDGKYILSFNDNIDIIATTDSDDIVNLIQTRTYTDEWDEDSDGDSGLIAAMIFSNDFDLESISRTLTQANEVYNDCVYGTEMHGVAANDNIKATLDFFYYEDNTSELFMSLEPCKYSTNEYFQQSSEFKEFTQTCCPAYGNEEEQEAQEEEEPQEEPQEESQPTYYGEGMYKVGVDIPAGEYNVQANAGERGYIEVSADASGDSIITNDIFNNNTYISVSDGQFLTLKSCYIQQ